MDDMDLGHAQAPIVILGINELISQIQGNAVRFKRITPRNPVPPWPPGHSGRNKAAIVAAARFRHLEASLREGTCG
ncbi:hypothetical protein [Pseudoroseomonas sp. WGS1072]|uniref:hypothetical protein n=1 Tax=Roseomonas sp. WGS1072 TaxID=3366816 RepID=UPI003BF23BFA